MGKYFDVTLYNSINKKRDSIKMEVGVSFENKNFKYTMNKDGNVSIFDKNTKKTTLGKEIKLTDYQYRTVKAVANNIDDTKDGNTALSADDVQTAINQYKEDSKVLQEDLKEFLREEYTVQNPKAFEEENKISAYIKNGKEDESAVLAFQFEKEYFDVSVKNITTNETKPIKMEKGTSFENNGAIYRMNNDGLLAVYDKEKGQWLAGIYEIKMTQYQIDTFEAVANNVQEVINGKKTDKTVFSKSDILAAIDLYKNNKLTEDLSQFLKITGNYKATNIHSYSNNDAISAYITNNNENKSATLIFKYGSAKEALDVSDFVHNNVSNTKATSYKTNPANKPVKKAVRSGELKDVKKMKPSNKAKELIKKRETLVLYTYDDLDTSNPRKFITKGMKYKGTLTNGYGHTKGVKPGQKISKKQAEKNLDQDMKKAINAIKENVKVKITQNQFDALISFIFNVGVSAFKNSTLLSYINENKFDCASAEFAHWIYSKGRKCKGLIDRRHDERALFDK